MQKIESNILENIVVGRIDPKIYAFSTQTVPNYLKIGDTYRGVNIRLNEWKAYFPNLQKQYENSAKVDENNFFRDYSVHSYLEKILNKERLQEDTFKYLPYYSNEFFKQTSVKDVKKALVDIHKDFKENQGKYQFYSFDDTHISKTNYIYKRDKDYIPRPNQQEAINNFKEAVKNGRRNLLMYAVMRFGKSFTSLCCAKEINAKFVVVVSAKADVKEEWKENVESIKQFEGYYFLDTGSLKQEDDIIKNYLKDNKRIILFLTLQDLQGEDVKERHKQVFEKEIDLLIIDETHFGARAKELGKILSLQGLSKTQQKTELKEVNEEVISEQDEEIIKQLNAKIRLHLSGTPYRILMSDEFAKDDIISFCQFSDIYDEYHKWNNDKENLDKDEWENPYYGFPQMVRFAFNPNESSIKRMEEKKKEGVSYSLSNLLATKTLSLTNSKHRIFENEKEILDLFQIIDGSKEDENVFGFLDYEGIKNGKMCRHIVCVLPYRASCDALEQLLSNNKSLFKNLGEYKIINISGEKGKKTYKTPNDIKQTISECEKRDIKTITLTVNRMLTGSTVKEWDTMIFLKDTASPQEYDQAIFRLQNQYIKTFVSKEGKEIKFNMKPQTLLVDFDPNRMFIMQEMKSQIYDVNINKRGNNELKERLEKELRISPMLIVEKNKLKQVEAVNIIDKVREYSNNKSVNEEAKDIPADLNLFENNPLIKQEIESQSPIDTKNGAFKTKANQGEGDDLDDGLNNNIDTETNIDIKEKDDKSTADNSEYDYWEEVKKKFATYYARILFFAFLSNEKITSLQDIINSIETNENSQRIAQNLEIKENILNTLFEKLNPFILQQLDYKINNLNDLINDTTQSPKTRVEVATRRFGRISSSEIVTPHRVAMEMVSILPDIQDNDSFLDIASKQGEFAIALLERFGNTIKDKIYSIPTSTITYEFTRKVYELLDMPIENVFSDINSYDLINENKKEHLKERIRKMNITTLVGNPPYQEEGGSGGNNDAPIYQKFSIFAKESTKRYNLMIIPARWIAAGRENLLGVFRREMLSARTLQKFVNIPRTNYFGNDIELKGGSCYYLDDNSYNGMCNYVLEENEIKDTIKINLDNFDILIREPKTANIVAKVEAERKNDNVETLDTIISSDTPFGIPSNPRTSPKNPFNVYTNRTAKHNTLLYHIESNRRKIEYVCRADISKNIKDIDRIKVFLAGSGGSGYDKLVLAQPELAMDNSVCSQSYLYVPFDTLQEAENLIKYIKTKFLRILVSAMKITQSAPKRVYQFVPLQDFTDNSDIDWSKSIEEIDKQLYKKYNLTQEEISFIENRIKPMK